jgi:hypothetical protein
VLTKITATVTLKSMSPMTQSAPYDDPALEGESPADRDKRLWRRHLHTIGDNAAIKATAMHKAIAAAAKYSGKKITGKGAKTWTAKFEAGIVILEDIDLGIPAADVQPITLFMNLDGRRGGSVRGHRTFPHILAWEATFDILILDPEITKAIFEEMMELAGLFVGIGQYRPEKGGNNGRFEMTALEWKADRSEVQQRAA